MSPRLHLAIALATVTAAWWSRSATTASAAPTPDGSGLRGLADRVAALDGQLRVHSPAGKGTRITAELPCRS